MKQKIVAIVAAVVAVVVIVVLGANLSSVNNRLSDEMANSNALQQQLTAAQADAAEQKTAAEDAQKAADEANTAKTEAETAAEEAKAAVEAAQAEAETAKADAEAAKTEAETAKAEAEAAKTEAETAKAEAEAAKADAEAAKAEAAKANEALAEAQKEAEEAQNALNDAKAALEAALTAAPAAEEAEEEEPAADEADEEEAETEPVAYKLGDTIADFSFTTYDGQEYTLSEVLKEKDMVLINLWATWCGPCQMEFPFMTEAYEEYKDKIEIFALSVEEEDTNEILADYVKEVGMTFPVGRDTAGLNAAFYTGYIPTTVVIDRNGVVCFYEYGSMPDADSFRRVFDLFVGDDYAGPVLQEGVPPKVPDVDPADSEALAVLNAEGGELVFTNPEDEYNWPVVLTTEDDKTCAVTSNVGVDESASLVNVAVTAQEGDALTFDYKVSSEAGFDFLTVSMNGESTKIASGETEWKTAVVPFPAAGEYEVSIGFVKDPAEGKGDDKAFFANVKVLTGDEAAEAVAALPEYPVSDEVALNVVTEGAKEIVFDDPTGLLQRNFGDAPYYVIPGDTAEFTATLTADYAPIYAVAQASTDEAYVMANCLEDGVYTFSTGMGASYNYVSFYPDCAGDTSIDVVYFAGEDAVNAFVARYLTEDDGTVSATWSYKDAE